MTAQEMNNFVQKLKDYHKAENVDSDKYVEMAKYAPNEETRKKLMQMAHDEIMHRAYLECMILDLSNELAK